MVIEPGWLETIQFVIRIVLAVLCTNMLGLAFRRDTFASPMYLLMLIGICISFPSFYSFGWILIYVVTGHIMILTEEEYLLKKYKNEYTDYCRNVPRYIGFIKK